MTRIAFSQFRNLEISIFKVSAVKAESPERRDGPKPAVSFAPRAGTRLAQPGLGLKIGLGPQSSGSQGAVRRLLQKFRAHEDLPWLAYLKDTQMSPGCLWRSVRSYLSLPILTLEPPARRAADSASYMDGQKIRKIGTFTKKD